MTASVGMSVERWKNLRLSFAENPLGGKKPVLNGYYYTSVETLNKILDSGTIFSTNYRYLNDPNEWEYGYKKLIKYIGKAVKKGKTDDYRDFIEKIISQSMYFLNDYPEYTRNPFYGNYSEIFTISFTKEEDLISQWDRYAKESGVVLEIDFSMLEEEKNFFYIESQEGERLPLNMPPQNVLYKKADIKNMAKRILDIIEDEYDNLKNTQKSIVQYDIYMFMRYYSSYIKNAAYKQEKEMRLSLYPLRNEQRSRNEKSNAKIVYTVQNHVLVPHVPVFYGQKNGDEIESCGIPIRSIKIGPGNNQETVYQGIIHRMECGKKQVALYDEDRIAETRNRFVLKGLAGYTGVHFLKNRSCRQNLTYIIEGLKKKGEYSGLQGELEEILGEAETDNLKEVSDRLHYIKKKYYKLIFHEIEKFCYCTSEGILIKRSPIPYLFSKN